MKGKNSRIDHHAQGRQGSQPPSPATLLERPDDAIPGVIPQYDKDHAFPPPDTAAISHSGNLVGGSLMLFVYLRRRPEA